MDAFELTILGCSSATPTSTRNPSAQHLDIAGRSFLIDCGEATQIQLRKYKIRFQRISRIFISHLHGDHYLGLMGLLASMHLLGRKNELHIHSPAGLREIIDLQHRLSMTTLQYEVIFHVLDHKKDERIYEDDKVTVDTIVLNHRVPCLGFLFREKPLPRKVVKEAIEKFKVPGKEVLHIKAGNDYVTPEGKVIPNAKLTEPGPAHRSFAYCSDTCYDESIIDKIKGVNLLYHEATFMSDMEQRAKETFHSTAAQAATIAKKAGAGKLIIGHYSARYVKLDGLLAEARLVFKDTVLGAEGEQYTP